MPLLHRFGRVWVGLGVSFTGRLSGGDIVYWLV